MTAPTNDLESRAKAYKALSDAYAADPAQPLYLAQVKRDAERAARWHASQPKEST